MTIGDVMKLQRIWIWTQRVILVLLIVWLVGIVIGALTGNID
jgi:hypothetical protein